MSLTSRWVNILYRVATGSRPVRNFFTPVGAFLFSLFVFGFVAMGLYLDRMIGLTDIFPERLNVILSVPFFSLALFLIGWSLYHFFKVKGTPVPFNPPPKLVTTGPYAFSRNPMLAGIFALLFGLGFLFESFSLVVVFTPLFILFNFWELKTIEEPELVKRLGQEYIAYREMTPMFFPRFRSKNGQKGHNRSNRFWDK